MSKEDDEQRRVAWHQHFAASLKYALEGLGVDVRAEFPVMEYPPTMDVVLIRRIGRSWNQRQRAWICDGIREVDAPYICIEFKYSESVNMDVLMKAIGCDVYLRDGLRLGRQDLRTFVVSSKTPSGKVIENAGYEEIKPGVLKSNGEAFNRVSIISLNELPATPHNLLFKLYASKKQQKAVAFAKIGENPKVWESTKLLHLVRGLASIILKREVTMAGKMTTSQIMDIGRESLLSLMSHLSVKERLAGISTGEMLEGISTEERLEGIPADQLLRRVPTEDRLEGIPADQLLRRVPTEARLKGISSEERVQGLSDEEMKHLFEYIKSKIDR